MFLGIICIDFEQLLWSFELKDAILSTYKHHRSVRSVQSLCDFLEMEARKKV